jgi:hypothetical protein
LALLFAGVSLRAGTSVESLRGLLAESADAIPALKLPDGKLVRADGDTPTLGVLRDKRLRNADMELLGRLDARGTFIVDPIHTRSIFVHKDGKRLMVTYWCDVCAIRTYSPGICWCCQQETALDLRERDDQP